MQFFIDSGDINAIKTLSQLKMVDGVTTNPSIIAQTGQNILDIIAQIADIIKGPISAEVTAQDYTNMINEANILTQISSNICIKLPLTFDGLKACRTLVDAGHKTNMTLCFSVQQALLAAKAGATYVSPFIGRLEDNGINGLEVLTDIRNLFDHYAFSTKILAASIRNPYHVKEAALIGADVATLPPTLFKKLIQHPLTDIGLKIFAKDIEKSNQKIL